MKVVVVGDGGGRANQVIYVWRSLFPEYEGFAMANFLRHRKDTCKLCHGGTDEEGGHIEDGDCGVNGAHYYGR
jgi:hypothetical protein